MAKRNYSTLQIRVKQCNTKTTKRMGTYVSRVHYLLAASESETGDYRVRAPVEQDKYVDLNCLEYNQYYFVQSKLHNEGYIWIDVIPVTKHQALELYKLRSEFTDQYADEVVPTALIQIVMRLGARRGLVAFTMAQRIDNKDVYPKLYQCIIEGDLDRNVINEEITAAVADVLLDTNIGIKAAKQILDDLLLPLNKKEKLR